MQRNPFTWFLIFLSLMMGFAVVVCGQETLPTPVGGPITEKLEQMVERFRGEERQEMQGLIDRLTKRDEAAAKEFTGLLDRLRTQDERLQEQYTGLLDRLRERDTSEMTRYHGLREMLQKILDRKPEDTSALFPRISEAIDGIRDLRADQTRRWTPLQNIIERIEAAVWKLGKLVIAVLAVGLLLLFAAGVLLALGLRLWRRLTDLPSDILLGKNT